MHFHSGVAVYITANTRVGVAAAALLMQKRSTMNEFSNLQWGRRRSLSFATPIAVRIENILVVKQGLEQVDDVHDE